MPKDLLLVNNVSNIDDNLYTKFRDCSSIFLLQNLVKQSLKKTIDNVLSPGLGGWIMKFETLHFPVGSMDIIM